MSISIGNDLDRRQFLTRAVPACAVACLGLPHLLGKTLAGGKLALQDEPHKFDVQVDRPLSTRQLVGMQYGSLIDLVKILQSELGQEEVIRLLNTYSAESGRKLGEQQARNAPDTSFQSFVKTFRPPNYTNTLTHEVVEDTEKVFQLRVTECIWADTFRKAGLNGEVGHAAICNMDYYWPPAFNPNFKMERDETLMQGHGQCNHRYLDTA